jgi:hypothetical protein
VSGDSARQRLTSSRSPGSKKGAQGRPATAPRPGLPQCGLLPAEDRLGHRE